MMQRTGMSEFLRWFQEHIGHEEGAFSKVEVAKIDESTGYGLFAKQNIRVNDVLLKIPDRFLITAHFVAKIPEYVECALKKLHFEPAEVLALFFAFERVYFDCICNKIPPADNGNTLINERSLDKCNAHGYEQFLRRRREKTVHEGQNASDAFWWKFYIGVLPRHFGTPLFQHYMAEDADARIKAIAAQLPHQMRHKLLAQLDELKSFEKKLFHVLFDPSDGFSELLKNENLIEKIEAVNVDQHFVNGESRLFWKEICCWSWHIVNTRSIFVDNLANGKDEKGAVKTRHLERRRKKMNGQEEQQQQQEEEYGGSLALIPLVDLFNHRPNAQCVPTWDRRSNCYLVIAEQHIISGQQLFLCYGAHENARLWIEYGFRMHENPLDRVSIPIELFIVLAERSGIRVSAKKKEILAKANLPCTIYASDDLPSYALRKNCSILQLTNDKLSKWSQYIFAPSMKEEDAEDHQEAEDRQEMELLKKILNLLTKALICRREECLDDELRPFWTDQIQILQKMMLNLESFIK